MAKEDFIQQAEFQEILLRAKAIKESGKEFSDVIDDNQYQYIDHLQQFQTHP